LVLIPIKTIRANEFLAKFS